MSSRQLISGESPPCTHRNCWLSKAARGRQSKASMQASYTRSEYLILPAENTKASALVYLQLNRRQSNQRVLGAIEVHQETEGKTWAPSDCCVEVVERLRRCIWNWNLLAESAAGIWNLRLKFVCEETPTREGLLFTSRDDNWCCWNIHALQL